MNTKQFSARRGGAENCFCRELQTQNTALPVRLWNNGSFQGECPEIPPPRPTLLQKTRPLCRPVGINSDRSDRSPAARDPTDAARLRLAASPRALPTSRRRVGSAAYILALHTSSRDQSQPFHCMVVKLAICEHPIIRPYCSGVAARDVQRDPVCATTSRRRVGSTIHGITRPLVKKPIPCALWPVRIGCDCHSELMSEKSYIACTSRENIHR